MTDEKPQLPALPVPVLHGSIDVEAEETTMHAARRGDAWVEELTIRRRVQRVVRIAVRIFGVEPLARLEQRMAARIRELEEALRPFAELATTTEGGTHDARLDALIRKAREVLP